MQYQDPTDDVIINDSTGDVITDAGNESGESSAPETQSVNNEVDDKGVTYKNRFFELERKYENLTKSIPQMIQEAATAAAQQTGSNRNEQKYTVNDYIQAKAQDPNNAAFYDAKIVELQKREITESVKAELGQFTRQQREEQARQAAEAWAISAFPQLRDVNNPFTQEVIRQFNSRSVEKREPHDFAIAAELVANRMGIRPQTQANPQQEKLVKTQSQVKKLLKERTLEGDGRGQVNVSQVTARQSDLKEVVSGRGNVRDYLQKYWIKTAQSE